MGEWLSAAVTTLVMRSGRTEAQGSVSHAPTHRAGGGGISEEGRHWEVDRIAVPSFLFFISRSSLMLIYVRVCVFFFLAAAAAAAARRCCDDEDDASPPRRRPPAAPPPGSSRCSSLSPRPPPQHHHHARSSRTTRSSAR